MGNATNTPAGGGGGSPFATDILVNGLTVGRGASNNTVNTAVGYEALYSNTTGYYNTAVGCEALRNNTEGVFNTAVGTYTLFNNTEGVFNTAVGTYTLQFNTTGYYNTAVGTYALRNNTTGIYNTAVGTYALFNNTAGPDNTAVGPYALYSNTTGATNTALGAQALVSNITGNGNLAVGYEALTSNTTGNSNTAVGRRAGELITTGSGNTAISSLNSAGIYSPVFDPTIENNRMCLGSTSVTNAYIQVAWTVVSDARDKTDFASVPHGLAFVCKLKPTAYRYKIAREATEGHGPLRYGFKAQDVLALEGATPVIVDNEDADKLRFNDQAMLAVLVKAIQELKAEFDLYKASHP